MLPVVAGRAATTRQILIYSGLLVLASELPWGFGFAGTIYGVTVAICGAAFLFLALQLNRSREADRRAAHRLFVFSIAYLFLLFATLLVDHNGGAFAPKRVSHDDRASAFPYSARHPSLVHSMSCGLPLGSLLLYEIMSAGVLP
jgi:hypothetical protein